MTVATNSPLSLADASVGSIMTKPVKTIETREPLFECVKLMKDANIGSLIVVESGKPVGIFTERDLVRKMADRIESLGLMMFQVMSRPLITISPSASVWDALTLMGRHNIRRLPVFESKKLVGILTERDVFRLIFNQQMLILESVYESIPISARERLEVIADTLALDIPSTKM